MASLYKRYKTVVDPATGEKVKKEMAQWWGRFIDAKGVLRRIPLAKDKSIAKRKLNDIVEKVALEKAGLISPAEKEMKKPLKEHIAAWKKHHAASENSEQYVHELEQKVNDIVATCGWRNATQINETDVEAYLYDLRKVRGLSIQTSNNYLRAIKNFVRWMVRNKRMIADPLAGLSMLNARTDRRHDRRPLDDEEFALMLQAAETGPPAVGLLGRDRAMLYLLAAWTGFRRGELGSLTLRSFDLESMMPVVTVNASYSKRRRRDTQPLHPDIVERLVQWLAKRKPKTDDEILFPISKKTCGTDRLTADMVKYDLGCARRFWIDEAENDKERARREKSDFLMYKNKDNLYADFHGLRHTFISNLGKAGVSPKTAQILARHSDIKLTLDIYTHIDQEERLNAINSLPSVPGMKKDETEGDEKANVPA